ncbi:MAG: hypothetical protein B7Y90_09610 [Alphaproteobacteria bacterium 32-64-14]|nr:MAG: hypothetical protein B7Y90_09610 [Alphaproteobacteria bacterium 32-64-14]
MSPAQQGNQRIVWLAAWALAALILVAGSGMAALNQDFAEPDNAMRLVRIRDMLAGQGWFDNVQQRLNPPDGTPMHWAQWIDALLAAPIALLRPMIGQASAEIVMAFAWPLGLLGVFMFLAVRIAGEIGARNGLRREAEWASAIIAALAFPVTEKFAPGSLDHHNVELVLGLGAVLGLMHMQTNKRAAAGAGAALGLAMATAAEGVPLVVAGLGIAGLMWLTRPTVFAQGLRLFGAGLAATSAVMLPVLVSPSAWTQPVCDAMGAPIASFGVIGGGIAIALSLLPARLNASILTRAASVAVLGAGGLTALYLLYPQCAGGGYAALGEDMSTLWMSQISEARSLVALAGTDLALTFAVAGAALAGLVAAAFSLRNNWRWSEGWVPFAFLIVSIAVMVWQIRGAAFATAFAIPFGAWAVAVARRDYRAKASAIRALAFAGVAASSAAAAWASAGDAIQSSITPKRAIASYEGRVAGSKACATPEAYRTLRDAPKGVMLNQFALGAGVLVWTDHSVLAAPYHRDVEGTMTVIAAMRASDDQAREIVTASAADYVLVCPATPETAFYARNAADGVAPDQTFSAMLGAGNAPDWLTPVDIGQSPLQLYRVRR